MESPRFLGDLASQPGIREALEAAEARSRFLTVAGDGTFAADSVEPGDYKLELFLLTFEEEAQGADVSMRRPGWHFRPEGRSPFRALLNPGTRCRNG